MKRILCRFTIEFKSPFLIGTGRGDHRADEIFVADANGLPSVPGTSLAGALREAYLQLCTSNRTDLVDVEALFGSSPAGGHASSSAGSAIRVSWGSIHDSRDSSVEGLRSSKTISEDPVLELAREGVHRHHVRISHRGVAEGRAKFDVEQVAAGHRFSFELSMDYGAATDDKRLKSSFDAVVGLLSSAQLTLGGSRGTGLGRFEVVRLHGREFDYTKDFVRLCELKPSIGEVSDLEVWTPPEHQGDPRMLTVKLPLGARGLWFVGAGEPDPQDESGADTAPVRESRVEWTDGVGEVVHRKLVVAGSAIRGPLRHRVAFHFNRFTASWANGTDSKTLEQLTGEKNEAVRLLFGRIADTRQGKEKGQRGLVRVLDVYVNEEQGADAVLPHVSLDRFTGGALEGLLFKEKTRLEDRLEVVVEIDLRRGPLADVMRKSLREALVDLAEGRLQVGAGSGRGNGFFELGDRQSVAWPQQLGPRPGEGRLEETP